MNVRSRRRRTPAARWAGALAAGALSIGVTAAAPSPSAAASPVRVPGTSTALVRVGNAPSIPTGARSTGPLRPSRSIELGLSLQPRDPSALAAYASAVSAVGSSEYHRYLTPATFAARFGPTTSEVARVERAMRSDGLAVGALSSNRLLLSVHGTVGELESAFHTHITGYNLAGGRSGWATTGAPRLDASTARSVQSVLGLDDLAVPQSQLRRAPTVSRVAASTGIRSPKLAVAPAGAPRACVTASQDALTGGGWTDSQIAAAYGLSGLYSRGDLGAGQTIALFELEPYAPTDVATFDRCYFGKSHVSQVQGVPVDGFDLVGSGSGESILDIEDLSALAPDAKILVYEAPNTTFGGIDEYNAIVSQDRANLVSTSWGECEAALQTGAPGAQQLENYIFEEAAAQGQTVISAAGDTGSDDCAGTPFGSTSPVHPYLSVDDPASQPYVLGVGGTSLLTDTNPPSQSVWNHGTDWGGGGGGLSTTWSEPSWQASSDVPGLATSGNRGVPDVSASADEWRGVTVYSKAYISPSGSARPSGGSTGAAAGSVPAGWTTIGGTSSAAPTWAAALADIAASGGSCATLPTTAGGTDLGFVSPELYAVASSPAAYAQSFSDITSGTNDVFGLGLGYAAGSGYNLASGLGTPIVTDATGQGGLDASLCAEASGSATAVTRPVVSSLTPSSGPTGGGGTVTIAGSNFSSGGSSSLHVSFGSASATVQSVSSTSITVTVPPSELASGASSVAAAGRVDVVVTSTTSAGAASSAPNPAASYEYVAQSSGGATVPSVSGIGPSAGNVIAGNTVTVYGAGFSAAGVPTVTFGGVAATGVDVLSDTELKAVVPAESGATSCASGTGFDSSSACQVEVAVSNANGASATVPILPALSGPVVFSPQGIYETTPETEIAPAATEYDYAPTPQITSITPDPADSSGSEPVTITGSGFNADTFEWVNFGPPSSSASEKVQITSISSTEITIVPPPGNGSGAGRSVLAGGVSVQSLGGLSNIFTFTYAGVPQVRSLNALGGSATGGTRITIHGSGLSDVTSVAFASEVSASGYGASRSSVILARTSSSLEVVAPADLPGPVDVEPCTPSGCAKPDPSADTFVYFSSGRPSLSLVTPRSGPAKGGTEVVMFGNNLDGAIGVRFGTHSTNLLGSTRDFPDGDPYVLAAYSPPGVAGSTVKVTVLTRTGSARVLSGGTFHYVASAPSPPRSVGISGHGTSVTVHWIAPASDGGSPITSYTVVGTTSGAAPTGGSFPSTARSAVLHQIVAGRMYTFRVVADNAAHGRGIWASVGPLGVSYSADGYRLAAASGAVQGFGSLPSLGGTSDLPAATHVAAIVATPDGDGYWLATSDGTVYSFGDASPYPYAHPASPVVGLAATPNGDGYWEVTASGTVYAFGQAHLYGQPDKGRKLSSPVTAIASSPDGRGYYVVTASGGVYSLGDAAFDGAAVGRAGGSVNAIAVNPDGLGYWLLTSSGKVDSFATVGFGSPSRSTLDGTAVAIASTPDGHGYWVATSAGAVYAFGDAAYEGRAAPSSGGYVGIATD